MYAPGFLESVREMQKFAERDQNMKILQHGEGSSAAPDAATNETFQGAEKLLHRGIHIICVWSLRDFRVDHCK